MNNLTNRDLGALHSGLFRLTENVKYEARLLHPVEGMLGSFRKGESIVVTVGPFRSALEGEHKIEGAYATIRVDGKPVGASD